MRQLKYWRNYLILKNKYEKLFHEYDIFKKEFKEFIELDETFPYEMTQDDTELDFNIRIVANKANLSKVQRRLVLYFYHNPEDLNLTCDELEEKIGIGRNNYTWLAQKLGYKGLKELRRINFGKSKNG